MDCVYALIALFEVCLPHTSSIITKNKLEAIIYKPFYPRPKEARLSVVTLAYSHRLPQRRIQITLKL